MTDLASSDLTYTLQTEAGRKITRTGPREKRALVQIAFSDGALTYPSGGVPLTTTPSDVGFYRAIRRWELIDPNDASGIMWKYDHSNKKLRGYESGAGALTALTGVITDDNNAATLGHAIYVMPAAAAQFKHPTLVAEGSATGLITDSNDAATEGVALYVVVDDPNWSGTYQLGHFEFVSPTNANGTCTIANGADTLNIYDNDDAATDGVAVRAVAAGAGLEATTAASKDILVPTSTGKYIHVNHATTGSTPELYFDEDASNTYERIRGVIVDNTDEPYKLFVDGAATENAGVALTQGAPGRLGVLVTSGPIPFTYLVGASGPEITIASRPDAASLVGAVVLTAAAAGAGLQAANFGKEDLYVPTSTGEFVKIAYAASPSGPQVYGYPEGATGDLRLQAVMVDNEDETFTTETDIGWRITNADASLSELDSASDAPAAQVMFAHVYGW